MKLTLEPLEDRRLLALLGVIGSAEAPLVTYNSTGTLTYNASTQTFAVDATPLTFTESFTPPSPTRLITAPADFKIQVQVNNAGILVAGAPGDDLVITGNIDIDGNGTIDAAGVLLTGEVLAMGILDGAGVDQYDFRFRPTGGALQAAYFAGKDVGITLLSEQSSFANSFAVDFAGGAKGNVFAIEREDVTFLVGSMSWEKRTDAAPFPLLGGATFVVSPDPFDGTGTLTVVDNGANDSDPDSGQIIVSGVRPGTYTVTETAPPVGFLLDDDPTRAVTVSENELHPAIGTQGQDDPDNSDESDFHNSVIRGSITVNKNAQPNSPQDFNFIGSFGPFQLDDDADLTLSNFQLFSNLVPGVYTIAETALPGWNLTNLVINDPDGGSSIDLNDRTATIDLDAGENITVTFTNEQLRASVRVVKTVAGGSLQDFSFSRSFGANFQLDNDDGLLRGNNSLFNSVNFDNLETGTFTITELPHAGFRLQNLFIIDPDGGSSINLATRTATIDLDAGENILVTFVNRDNTIVETPDKSNASQPFVQIVDASTGEVTTRFLAYEQGYRGGVRVATGDLDGDGIAEIVTAPGRSLSPRVKVFDQQGNLLYSFLAYPNSFKGGVDVAVGDVNGDGKNDVVTAMTYNGNQVKVFQNVSAGAALQLAPFSSFRPLGSGFKGGATVEVADLGRPVSVGAAKKLDSSILDGRGEIIVGSGSGMPATLKVFTYFSSSRTATPVRTYRPFGSSFRGGLTLDVARVDADLVPDIVVAAGNGGASQVLVLNGISGSVLSSFKAYAPPDAPSGNAPVHVAAFDSEGDGIADCIFAAQGTDGASRKIRRFDALSGELVDEFFESTTDFGGAYFLATFPSQPVNR